MADFDASDVTFTTEKGHAAVFQPIASLLNVDTDILTGTVTVNGKEYEATGSDEHEIIEKLRRQVERDD